MGDEIALTREAILAADDLTRERVEIGEPSWPSHVYIGTFMGSERDKFERACADRVREGQNDMEGLRAYLLVLTICDENGVRLFSDDDVDALNQKSAKVLDKLFAISQRLNHLLAEDVDILAGNSKSGLSESSGLS